MSTSSLASFLQSGSQLGMAHSSIDESVEVDLKTDTDVNIDELFPAPASDAGSSKTPR